MRQSTIACLIFSVLLACACSTIQRPDTNLYGVNAPAMKVRGYNIRRDFSDEGVLSPGAKPTEKPISGIQDLNAWICTDPTGFQNLKVYVQQLRKYYDDKCGGAQ